MKCLATLLVVGCCLDSAVAQGSFGNLIGNGSFESISFTPDVNISPWRWSGCLILIVAEPQHVADGNNCAVVCGSIFQDLTVSVGQLYQLRFAFGGDDQAQANLNPLEVTWGNQTIASIPVEPASEQSPNWRYLSFDVVANSPTMRLGFTTYPNQAFPFVDNVSVVGVPEPRLWSLLAFAAATLMGCVGRRDVTPQSSPFLQQRTARPA